MVDSTLYLDTIIFTDTLNANIIDTCVQEITAKEDELACQPGPWAPIWVPTVSSIIVFAVGMYFTRKFKRKDEKESRAKYRNMVIDWIEIVKPVEELLVQSIERLAEAIETSENMQPVPYAMPQSIPDKLNELSLKDISDAFLLDSNENKKDNNTNLFNIISGFEFLYKMNDHVKTSYEKYNKSAFDICKEWNHLFTALIDEINKSVHFKDYRAIVIAWQTELVKETDSMNVHQKHLNQLFEKVDSIKDPVIMSFVNRMQIILEQSKALNKGFATNFANMAKYIEITSDSLSNAARFFMDRGSCL